MRAICYGNFICKACLHLFKFACDQYNFGGLVNIVYAAYLPGTEETAIMKVVPPRRGSPLHSDDADPCDYPKCG